MSDTRTVKHERDCYECAVSDSGWCAVHLPPTPDRSDGPDLDVARERIAGWLRSRYGMLRKYSIPEMMMGLDTALSEAGVRLAPIAEARAVDVETVDAQRVRGPAYMPPWLLDIPMDLKVRWRICRNCDHTEVNHTLDHTRCLIPKFACPCPGYAAYDAEGGTA